MAYKILLTVTVYITLLLKSVHLTPYTLRNLIVNSKPRAVAAQSRFCACTLRSISMPLYGDSCIAHKESTHLLELEWRSSDHEKCNHDWCVVCSVYEQARAMHASPATNISN